LWTGSPYVLSGAGELAVPFALQCDMDVNDTAYLNIVINGTQVITVSSDLFFNGYLLP
jgi:hypothetical protein